jgi:hypothetical protein
VERDRVTLKASDGVAALQKELKQAGNNVDLTPGERWLIKSGRLEPAEGVTLNCNGAVFYCPQDSVRLTPRDPKVTVKGLRGIGCFTVYNYADQFTIEDFYITHSLDGKTYLPLGKKGGATAAIMTWLSLADRKTLRGVTIRNGRLELTYHHGIGMSLSGGVQEGGGFKDILIEDVTGVGCGSGLESTGTGQTGDRDWSTMVDVPDIGDIENLTGRRIVGTDTWQSTVHMDGSWTGHRQIQKNIIFEDCLSVDAGRRSGTIPGELYQSGFYLQRAKLVRCGTIRSRKAGFLVKNAEANSLEMIDCWSRGCAYGLVIEYGGVGAKVKNFVAEQNTRRALQATAQNADIAIEIRDFKGAGRPVLLGITERLEFVDSTKPGNIKTLATRRADAKPFTGKLRIRATGRDLVEVHRPSKGVVSLDGVSYLALVVDDEEEPAVILPNPVPQGSLYLEDGGWIWYQAPECTPVQLRTGETALRIPDAWLAAGGVTLRAQYGAVKVGANGHPEYVIGWIPDELRQFYRDVAGVL